MVWLDLEPNNRVETIRILYSKDWYRSSGVWVGPGNPHDKGDMKRLENALGGQIKATGRFSRTWGPPGFEAHRSFYRQPDASSGILQRDAIPAWYRDGLIARLARAPDILTDRRAWISLPERVRDVVVSHPHARRLSKTGKLVPQRRGVREANFRERIGVAGSRPLGAQGT